METIEYPHKVVGQVKSIAGGIRSFIKVWAIYSVEKQNPGVFCFLPETPTVALCNVFLRYPGSLQFCRT